MTKKKMLLQGLLIGGFILGCAKERPYEDEHKMLNEKKFGTNFKELQKGMEVLEIGDKESHEFLYVPNTQGIPSFTTSLSPFVQGNEKIVRLRFTEDGLMAYQVSRKIEELIREQKDCEKLDPKGEAYTNANCKLTMARSVDPTNLEIQPIVTIPGDYKSYRCRTNANNDCTGVEEENTELEWYQKDKFIPDYTSIKVHELDSVGLPDKSDPCFSETGVKVTHHEMTAENINFELEKTYKFSDSESCIMKLWYSSNGYEEFVEKLNSNGSFNARVFFSFARLDKISTKNYKKVDYPLTEHGRFGFFKTSFTKKDSNRRNIKEYVMNRWNPAKNNGQVTYYLSDEYFKPENKYLLDATKVAFDRMNLAMKKSGVKLSLKLITEKSGKKAGDLRYTMVNLIEDIASPLLGYGPTVANPRTGEIVKGHTNMYKGSLESFAPSTYDGIRDHEAREKRRTQNTKDVEKILLEQGRVNSEGHQPVAGNEERKRKVFVLAQRLMKRDKILTNSSSTAPSMKDINKIKNKPVERIEDQKLAKFIDKMAATGNFDRRRLELAKEEVLKKERIYDTLHRNNVYTADVFNFQNLGKQSVVEINAVKDIRDEKGVLKEWKLLTKKQKRELTEILVTHAYIPTLVHEIGHNLGLRHNFEGSADKQNYYNQTEMQALGLKGTPAYSSIMDYAYSGLNELATFGSYDLAALKFAYNREVQLADGSVASVANKPLMAVQGVKNFKFCTDENAGASLLCNRFDEGANEMEVMNHYRQKYVDYYQYTNLKGRKKSFNEDSHWSYLISLYRRFSSVRNIHEQWQSLHSFLQQYQGFESVMFTGCSTDQIAQYGSFCQSVDETIKANHAASRFFIDIAKTPDLTCHIVANASIGEQTVFENTSFFFNLGTELEDTEGELPDGSGFYKPHTCFDANVQAKYQEMFLNYIMGQCQQGGGNPMECMMNIKMDINVFGEQGRAHNDVSKAVRFDEKNLIGDLEIRGTWIDKVMAMWFITSPDLMTTAGASNHMSIATHPQYKEEVLNLMRHFAYGEPLLGQRPFEAYNGMQYHTTNETDLNLATKVPRDKEWLSMFLHFPDFENFKIGPVIHNMAAKKSYSNFGALPNDLDFLAKANKFHKAMSLYTIDNITSGRRFGSDIIKQYSFPEANLTVGATKDNTIALDLISMIDGTMESSSIAKIAGLKKKIDDASIVTPEPTPEPSEDDTDVATDTEEEGEETETNVGENNEPDTTGSEDTNEGDTTTAEDTTPEEKEPTAGKEAIETLIAQKRTYRAAYEDVAKIEMAFLMSKTPEEFSERIGIIESQISAARFEVAMSAFQEEHLAETEDENLKELKKMKLHELEFFMADEDGKKAKLKQARNGLYMLLQEDGISPF